MADSTVIDVSKMKVVELRKELKARGLPYAGDKAELVNRLQTSMQQDDTGDINLDSDEIDSDGVLEDDDKSQSDILEDTTVETINEELALAEPTEPPVAVPEPSTKPTRTLKRKITLTETLAKDPTESKLEQNKETTAKKIVLNRAVSITKSDDEKTTENPAPTNGSTESNVIKVKAADLDPKTRLEMRAKRFGLPVNVSDDVKKEARKMRFGQSDTVTSTTPNSGSLTDNLDKLKKRSERFGQSVSKIMSDIEAKEKIEKRKAKFGTVK